VLRRSSTVGFYDKGSIQRLIRLGSHLSNADRILAKMSAAGDRTKDFSVVLERLGVAAFLTD